MFIHLSLYFFLYRHTCLVHIYTNDMITVHMWIICIWLSSPKVPGFPGCAISLEAEVHPWIRLNRYLLSDVADVCWCFFLVPVNMDVSENSGTPKSSILIGFSIINHPCWGTPIFGNTHMKVCVCRSLFVSVCQYVVLRLETKLCYLWRFVRFLEGFGGYSKGDEWN